MQLPTRLGIALRPMIQSVVRVSKGARISRSSAKVDGIDTVIKSDQLRKRIERTIDDASGAATLLSAAKMIGSDTLEAFAKQLSATASADQLRLGRQVRVEG